MKVPLVFTVLFLATAYIQAQDQECSYTCSITSQPNPDNNGNWAVVMDNGVSYFYLIKYNSFVIVNRELSVVLVINGNDGTLTVVHTETGFGGIINLSTNIMYHFTENLQKFDITTLADQDYTVIVNIVEYTLTYKTKVIGDTIDTTQPGYEQLEVVLRDYANTTDYTLWVSYHEGQPYEDRVKIATILKELFDSKNYTVEWGSALYIVVVTKMYEYDDALLEQFNNFAISIVRTLHGRFTAELMAIYYEIITSQGSQSIEVITQQFRNLTWSINGVGTTYESLLEALLSYKSQTVVQTYVSTIVVSDNSSYVAYNSMRNGTWIFRITYSNQHYVQVTSSYYDQYMGIFDPSLEYVLVFTKTNQFGLINYKTGNGLIIDGHTQKGTYVISNDENIVKAFAENHYNVGFKLTQTLIENTKIKDGDSFNALDLFKAVKKGDPIENLLSGDKLSSFQADFATLSKNLANINFDNGSGVTNIVGMMLAGPNSEFFQLGFVKMIFKMFDFQLSGGALFRIAYAGILNSIENFWNQPIFENMVTVMGYLKRDNNRDKLIAFLENFCFMSWGIDVNELRFTIDGSYNKA